MKVSVITVCKNSAKCIERAIKSVISQTYTNIQYIIIDGQSSDNTMEIINNYKQNIDTILSEPDTGIYNAMNKALYFVTGEIIYFLNSDDYFYDNEVVTDIASVFMNNKDYTVVYGNVIINENCKHHIVKYEKINRRYFYDHTICHQVVFTKKIIFDLVGGFNENYPIHADIDWLMRAFLKHRIMFHYIDRIICYYSSEGFSSDSSYANMYKYDRLEISSKHFIDAKLKLILKRILKNIGFHI